jgi:hypothetical protein
VSSFSPNEKNGASVYSNRKRTLLRLGHQFQHMAVGTFDVDAAAAIPIIELAVFETPGRATIGEA